MDKQLIVIVDDEPEILEFLTLVLEDAGYHVHTANEPAAAYLLIVELQPDLALLDVRMGHPRAGLDLMEQLRETAVTAAVPILFLSGEVRLLQQERAHWRSRGCDVLTKPFSIAALLAKVATALGPSPVP